MFIRRRIGFRQRARRGQLRLQVAKLGAIRQPAVPQQVAGLLERRVARQVVDVVSAIREHAAIAVEETNPRRRRDDVFESAFGFFPAVAISDQSYRERDVTIAIVERAWIFQMPSRTHREETTPSSVDNTRPSASDSTESRTMTFTPVAVT